ncbi:MAG TPA: PPC domain-containing protein, partial [Pirellulales bacterium]|nr:PPC domain-containing protein [Pirellulales bacterium]
MRPTRPKILYFAAIIATALALGAAPALAQLPDARLFSVFPPGGQAGSKVEVTLTGVDLDGVDRLHFSHAGISAAAKVLEPSEFAPTARPAPNQFVVTIAPDVSAGRYEVRAVGKYGVSNPRSFVVGREAELVESEPNNTLEKANEVKLGTTINGRCEGGTDLDHFQFTASAGQRLLIDCDARRIDSRLEAVLVLLDSKGRELARAAAAGRQDPLLDFSVPADGDYTLVVHDFIYNGSNEYFYRLTLGTGPHVDFVFPPAGLAGSKAIYRIYGRNLPGGQPAQGLAIDGRPLEALSVEIQLPAGPEAQALAAELPTESHESSVDGMAYRLPTPAGPTNPVLLSFASAPVVVEAEPNDKADKAQRVTPPCECAGQYYPAGDFDWYTFEAKQGDVLWIELFSQRLGLASDPFLLVQQVKSVEGEKPADGAGPTARPKEQVVDLQAADDVAGNVGGFQFTTTHDDPYYRFVAPVDGTYRVLVRDLSSSIYPDPRRVYRLAIRPEQPDFRLVAVPRFAGVIADPNQNQPVVWSPLLRKGGSELVDVLAFRRDGFDGEIVVSAEGLPGGVTATPATIGPGQSSATLVLAAADSAPASLAAFGVVGKAKLAESDAIRTARGGSLVWPGQIGQFMARARLCQNLVLAVSDEPAPFLLQAGNEVIEMSRAGKIEVPVTIARKGDFKGNVALAPYGLPPAVQPQNITLDGNTASGTLTLNLQANAPVGTYSFYLLGTTQVSYRRNPEAAEAAAKRKADVERLFTDAMAQAKAT